MKTETTTETAIDAPPPVASAPKLAKTFTITLSANGTTLTLVAERTGDTAKTYVLTMDSEKKSSRGMTASHDSFEDAKAAMVVAAAKAEKMGWTRRQPRIGFVAKPDAFSAIPAAPKAPKAKK